MYFYNARYYDSYLNRFISPDTIIPDPANPQSLNRYSYCLNNPLRYVDYSGHTPWDVIDAIFWVLSANDFVRDPTWGNAFWLALDTVSLAPVLPSLGYITRGSKLASKYDDIAKFVVKYGDEAMQFLKIADKKGAMTLIEKFLSTSADTIKGARFELEYALQFSDEIVEIGRKLPGNSEIDFVTKGNVFVNVKNFDWADSFFQKDFGLKAAITKFLHQYDLYMEYGASQVKFVFKGSVPDAVREALEAIGAIVEVIP